MKILTSDNVSFDMNALPDEVDDLRYCVLDYSNQADVDYFFVPLMFLESFTSPAALIQIGDYQLQVPLDWSIVIGDKHIGDLELLEVSKLNDRPFKSFVFNPIAGFSPNFYDITILDIFPDIKWHFPKLKFGHILAVPMGEQNEWPESRTENMPAIPDCVFIVRDVNKLPDSLDIGKVL